MSSGAFSKKTKGAQRDKIHSFGYRNVIFGKQAQCDKGKQQKISFVKISVFDEFMGPLKGALRGPKGPLRAKSRSFGDRNIIFGNQAQCDKVKQKKLLFLKISVFDE